jgi:starch synthase
MRVAIISYGFVEYCIQQANGLARESDVLLILPRDEAAEHQATIDPTVHFQPFDKPRFRQPLRQIKSVCGILRQIRKFRPDVMHFQQGHMWFNLALPLLRSIPLVITIHDPRYHVGDRDSRRTPQWIMDFGFRCGGRIIVHGEALRRQVVELLGIPAERVHVVPHVAIGASKRPMARTDDGKTVLFFGRIWDYKGLDHLIKAEPIISNAVPDVKIVIAGRGDDFEKYRRQIVHPERFEVHNRFITTSHRDELFNEASIVALPYIEATQSGVIPLAYSFERPVVATRVGALEEAVEDGITGRLVPPADAVSLAAAIVDLLKSPSTCHAMGAAGRQKLDSEWSPKAVAYQTLDVYCRAIRDREITTQPVAVTDRVALELK